MISCMFYLIISISLAQASPIRIDNGTDSGLGLAPWNVQIEAPDSRRLTDTCSGSIISRQHIITTKHCYRGAALNNINVYAGQMYGNHNLSDGYSVVSVNTIYNHSYLDLAIYKLSQPFKFRQTEGMKPAIMPINLPKKEMITPEEINLCGWGLNGNDISPIVLQCMHGNITKCTQGDNKKHFCILSQSTTCGGDSGAGTWAEDEDNFPILIGVHRGKDDSEDAIYDSTACLKGLPMEVKVTPVIDWITNIIDS